MDAVKYLKEAIRMCDTVRDCEICPLRKEFGGNIAFPCKATESNVEFKNTEKCVSIVEKWSEEHPVNTRQNEFLKLHPNAKIDSRGVLEACPLRIDTKSIKVCGLVNLYRPCKDCRKEYWLAEVE